MKRKQAVMLVVVLALIGATGGLLVRFRSLQKLGQPGVKTSALPGSMRLRIDLPERLPGYDSKWYEPSEAELGTLPADTSFGKRVYHAEDGFEMLMTAVLMGTDRTSLHKPQICLEGQGCHIDGNGTLETSVHVDRPCAYDLPVVRLLTNNEKTEPARSRGVYVYWYVADGALSASVGGYQRMWWMARELALTGILQRWAYVSCFAQCAPGQEEATFERMKQVIATAVPEFQLTPAGPPVRTVAPNSGAR